MYIQTHISEQRARFALGSFCIWVKVMSSSRLSSSMRFSDGLWPRWATVYLWICIVNARAITLSLCEVFSRTFLLYILCCCYFGETLYIIIYILSGGSATHRHHHRVSATRRFNRFFRNFLNDAKNSAARETRAIILMRDIYKCSTHVSRHLLALLENQFPCISIAAKSSLLYTAAV